MNDVAYNGGQDSSDMGLSFISDFSKQACGEKFKIALTIINVSDSYVLDRVSVKVVVTRQSSKANKSNNELVLCNDKLDKITQKGQHTLILTFNVEQED